MNKKTTWLIVALVILALAAFLDFGIFSKNKLPAELIVSGHPEWPPIMYQQNDQIVGAGPEIVAKIFQELGIKVVPKFEGSWETVQSKAKDGSVDVLAAAYKTAERETYMDYSIPYTVDPVVLVTKKGKAFPYDKWDDLVGKNGVVTTGDSYGQDFDNFLKEKLTAQKVGAPAEAFALLDQGKADYFVYALYSAENYFFQQKAADRFEIIPKYVSSENFYLTVSKKSPFASLLPQVNALLEKYKADGTIDRIIESKKQSLWSENK
ncbi:MAG: transporter substrate-binding domain-containing protein [Parcubacteria group bacterium]|jgi:polar amino acid transport system substrate-binding protein